MKKVIYSCVACNKLEGASYSSVAPPDLPDFCTSEDPPFCHTGIDFTGPLFVVDLTSHTSTKRQKASKNESADMSGTNSKWIALVEQQVNRQG